MIGRCLPEGDWGNSRSVSTVSHGCGNGFVALLALAASGAVFDSTTEDALDCVGN